MIFGTFPTYYDIAILFTRIYSNTTSMSNRILQWNRSYLVVDAPANSMPVSGAVAERLEKQISDLVY